MLRLKSRWATRKSPDSSRRAATGSIRGSTSISSSCPPAAAVCSPPCHVWRRLLAVGPKEFGETYYLGTLPLIDHDGLFDVLVGTHNVVEAQFAFDPQSGQLVALEMFPETNTDPCEIYFSDYRPVGDRVLPHRMTVRFGDAVYGELVIERFELAK